MSLLADFAVMQLIAKMVYVVAKLGLFVELTKSFNREPRSVATAATIGEETLHENVGYNCNMSFYL